jgi:hypothetical protein
MYPIQAAIAAQHLADLQREAQRNHLAKEARRARIAEASFGHQPPTGGAEPRRSLARLVAGVSRRAADTARWLDPSVEVGRARRASQLPGC